MNRLLLALACLVYSLSLRFCPASFRRRLGDDARRTFVQRARMELRAGGRLALLRWTILACNDSLAVALTRRPLLTDRPHGSGLAHPRPRGVVSMRSLLDDVTIGARVLLHRPAFAAVGVGTIALAIGVNTAIFSVVNGVLLKPLPYPQPDRLVALYHAGSGDGAGDRGRFSLPDLEDWNDGDGALEAMGLYTTLLSGPLLTGGNEPVELDAAYVTRGFFPALGQAALIGRTFDDAEQDEDNHVVVLAHGFWRQRFGADPEIVGSTITLDDEPYRVVGVMPQGFAFPGPDVQAWLFLTVVPTGSAPYHLRPVRFLDALGRLAPGVSLGQARERLDSRAAALAREFPDDNARIDAAAVLPLREIIVGDVDRPLLVLLGAVLSVLLIACVNLATLLLAHGAERRRELALRAALGAGRFRLVRQLVTESFVLGGVGAIGGVILGAWLVPLLVSRADGLLPRAAEVGLDVDVLLFSVVLTVATVLGFALLPALVLTRASVGAVAGGDRRASRRRTGGWLVGAEVALAVVLVVGAGLLLRSFRSLQQVDIGVDAERLLTATLTFNDARYPERAQFQAAASELRARLAAMPGVESVATARSLPLRFAGEQSDFFFADEPDPGRAARPEARVLQVGPGFFHTAGVPLRAGRPLAASDDAHSPPVAVVNEAFVARHASDREVLGAVVDIGGTEVRIVGVVGDIRQRGPALDPEPTLYRPQAQDPRRGMSFLIRTAGDPSAIASAVRTAVREVDPDQPIEELVPMADVAGEGVARPRFFAVMVGGFGTLAMALAVIGIYGVVADGVASRTREIGVRMALGAERRSVVALVLGQGMRPVFAGTVIGLVGAALSVHVLDGLLHGVEALDPLTFATVPALLLLTALAATAIPAVRSAAVDPTVSLRSD